MLKVSQIQLSHAAPILMLDRAQIVQEVGFVAVLYASLSKEAVLSYTSM